MTRDDGKLLAAARLIRSLDPDGSDAMKLEKLLYYTQGLSLALTGDPMFRQQPEAWAYGPVYARVYQANKYEPTAIKSADLSLLSPTEKKLIEATVMHYQAEAPWSMSVRTHEEAPWRDARKGLAEDEHSHRHISHESMMRHFSAEADSLPQVDIPSDTGWRTPSDEEMDREAERFAELLKRLAS